MYLQIFSFSPKSGKIFKRPLYLKQGPNIKLPRFCVLCPHSASRLDNSTGVVSHLANLSYLKNLHRILPDLDIVIQLPVWLHDDVFCYINTIQVDSALHTYWLTYSKGIILTNYRANYCHKNEKCWWCERDHQYNICSYFSKENGRPEPITCPIIVLPTALPDEVSSHLGAEKRQIQFCIPYLEMTSWRSTI